MCSQLEILQAAYGNVFTTESDERYALYSFSREHNNWPMHEASAEWKQTHGTDFHWVEVMFATVMATGSTKFVERLTENPPPPQRPA